MPPYLTTGILQSANLPPRLCMSARLTAYPRAGMANYRRMARRMQACPLASDGDPCPSIIQPLSVSSEYVLPSPAGVITLHNTMARLTLAREVRVEARSEIEKTATATTGESNRTVILIERFIQLRSTLSVPFYFSLSNVATTFYCGRGV